MPVRKMEVPQKKTFTTDQVVNKHLQDPVIIE